MLCLNLPPTLFVVVCFSCYDCRWWIPLLIHVPFCCCELQVCKTGGQKWKSFNDVVSELFPHFCLEMVLIWSHRYEQNWSHVLCWSCLGIDCVLMVSFKINQSLLWLVFFKICGWFAQSCPMFKSPISVTLDSNLLCTSTFNVNSLSHIGKTILHCISPLLIFFC
jgi:hypothetical protein